MSDAHGSPRLSGTPVSRRPSPAVYRRRRLTVFGSALLLLALLSYVIAVLAVPLPSAVVTVTQAETVAGESAPPAIPPQGSTAAIAPGFGSLGAEPSHDVVSIASMTKVITALMVLKAHPLTGDEAGPTITFGDADVAQINDVIAQNGNYADVAVGDTTTELDALYAMLLKSANNIAGSLAIWAYGSMDEFVAQTNAWLTAEGLSDTVVVDASGLNGGTKSSAANLIAIGQKALADPVLAKIVSTKSIELPLFGKLVNGNTLLGVSGIDGIKTGTTDEAGACLLYSARFEVAGSTVNIFGVTTGAAHQAEVQPMVADYVASLEAGFHETTLADPGVSMGSVTSAWGTTSDIVSEHAVSTLTWSDTPVAVHVTVNDVRSGGKGTRVGRVTFDSPSGPQSVDLVLAGDLGDPGPGWRFSHVSQLFG